MPPRSGRFAGVRYAFESRAGRLVAGDLFDVLALDDGRAAFFLGDVSGKGIGAAVLMSAAQSQLRTLLLSGTAVDAAVASLNRHLHERSEPGKFVTLVAGVIDAERGVLEIVDAGHGFCTIAGPEGRAARLEMGGGLPLGVVPEGAYTTTVVPLAPGARVVVFTDGVVEQTDASGRQFGFDAALEVLGRASGPEADAAELLRAVAAHAGGALADDLTVASLMLVREDP